MAPWTQVEQEIDDENEEQVQETETHAKTFEVNLDWAEDRTAAQVEVTEVQTDSILQRRLAVLQIFSDL